MSDTLTNPETGAAPGPLASGGIVGGPGNQGSANQAHMVGQAGTAGTFIALPRQLKGGASGSKPQ